MKKILLLSCILFACHSKQTSSDNHNLSVQHAEADLSHCTFMCHHTASTSSEEYDCHQECKKQYKAASR